MTTLSTHLLLVDKSGSGVRGCGCYLLDGAVHNEFFVGTNHYHAFAGNHDVEARGIDVAGINDAGKPLQRDIGTQQGHCLSFAVMNGNGVGAEHHLRSCVIVIGLAPHAFACLCAIHVKIGFKVIVRGTTDLRFFYRTVLTLGNIRFEPKAFFLVIVCPEHKSSTNDGWVVLNHSSEDWIE